MRSASISSIKRQPVLGDHLEVGGEVVAGDRVVVAAVPGHDLRELAGRDPLGALEHQVLEEVRQARLADRAVGRADPVPEPVRHHRCPPVRDHDHLEPVVEREAFRVEQGGRDLLRGDLGRAQGDGCRGGSQLSLLWEPASGCRKGGAAGPRGDHAARAGPAAGPPRPRGSAPRPAARTGFCWKLRMKRKVRRSSWASSPFSATIRFLMSGSAATGLGLEERLLARAQRAADRGGLVAGQDRARLARRIGLDGGDGTRLRRPQRGVRRNDQGCPADDLELVRRAPAQPKRFLHRRVAARDKQQDRTHHRGPAELTPAHPSLPASQLWCCGAGTSCRSAAGLHRSRWHCRPR